MTLTAHPPRSSNALRWWRNHASFVVLLFVLVGVAYLYFGIPRDSRNDLSDSSENWRGDSGRGLFFAYAGTLLVTAAQTYTIVKRVGSPAFGRRVGGVALWLNIHIVLSVIGVVMVLLHAGFPFDFRTDRLTQQAYAGLATWLLLVTMISGVFGRYLYRRLPTGKRAFAYWKETHLVMTVLFFVFALLHIIGVED